ncbi:transcriptional regulator SplA domain-containing protein [Heyndrickxia oleronia]|jgi:transcriptional regulator of the spore photoproduct lyase operon|uniref:transcriptional regulator SplA domain-containing protein n=1 Tax=Heyndrickxia oleronia TaxID=38875 RepID=UPI000904562B|nr:transcriptional regulator SplA domain-containing protein [Heyndrickxia oleronia]NYV68549.1 transcriptional regulator [Bacillus sp. Gen3]OJH20024.1 transcriptional regulator [Bacillus obstructivus]MBU5212450.1 transcriptional regulator [Heyndrickxia oleronia]MCI1592301.1 transcriptional regulator [Heyndrickxia oleronia]MCI1615202.1 transcriptional regulator [Heyndrickxia oleronia]
MDNNQAYKPGEVVYVIIRNPHAQDVANVQQAAVVQNPESPNQLALFLHETYYPLTDEFAVFPSESEAEQAYQEAFGFSEDELGGHYG